jgi:hypothetical protein
MSATRSPAAWTVVRAARLLRLGIASRKRTTSSTLSTTGSLRDLVQRRPRDPWRRQMNLEGTDILKIQTIGGSIKIPAELRDRVQIRSLRRGR